MYIWQVHAFDIGTMKDNDFALDDSDILIDCVCETSEQVYNAIISKSLKECSRRGLDFNGFNILAC